jgi:uncharacterized protein YbaA (DUF1428 family)
MAYVDGFIVAVPKKNIAAYRKISTACGKVWREYGALDYREWVADDVKVGKLTSFPRAVKLKPSETVVFSWITYKSRAQREGQRQGDGRSAAQGHDESEGDAVRCQADDLWRIRKPGEGVIIDRCSLWDANHAAAT